MDGENKGVVETDLWFSSQGYSAGQGIQDPILRSLPGIDSLYSDKLAVLGMVPDRWDRN